MAGNVSIVKVGESPEEKAQLLAATGLNRTTTRQVLGAREGNPTSIQPRVASEQKTGTVVPRPAAQPYGNRTPINTTARPLEP